MDSSPIPRALRSQARRKAMRREREKREYLFFCLLFERSQDFGSRKNFASLSSYFSCRIYTSFGMTSINSKKWHKPNLPITAQVICCPMQVHRVYRLANHKSDSTSSSSFPPRGPRVRTAFFVQRGLQRTLSWALEIGKIAGVKHQGTVCAATFLLGTTPPQQARAVRAPSTDA